MDILKNNLILSYYVSLILFTIVFYMIVINKDFDGTTPFTLINLPSNKILLNNTKTSIKYTENGMIVVITTPEQQWIDTIYEKLTEQFSFPPGKHPHQDAATARVFTDGIESHIVQLTNGLLIELWGNEPETINKIKGMDLFSMNTNEKLIRTYRKKNVFDEIY